MRFGRCEQSRWARCGLKYVMEMDEGEDNGENVLIGVWEWKKGGGVLIMKN